MPDLHLRQQTHEDVTANLLTQLHDGTFTGTKPAKGKYSSMSPSLLEGANLAVYLLEQPAVLEYLSRCDPQDLRGCVRAANILIYQHTNIPIY